jgi:hypothetical protein
MSTARATLSNRLSTDDNIMGAVVGVVGCGRWGMTHLKTLSVLKDRGLISAIHACDINSSTESEATKYADTFCTDWQTLVSNHQLDAVAVVTPVDTHHDLALPHEHTRMVDHRRSVAAFRIGLERPSLKTNLEDKSRSYTPSAEALHARRRSSCTHVLLTVRLCSPMATKGPRAYKEYIPSL